MSDSFMDDELEVFEEPATDGFEVKDCLVELGLVVVFGFIAHEYLFLVCFFCWLFDHLFGFVYELQENVAHSGEYLSNWVYELLV